MRDSLSVQMNRLMEKVSEETECNAECQEQRRLKALFNNWKNAETAYEEGIGRVDEKERIYLTAKLGEAEAAKLLRSKFRRASRDDVREEVMIIMDSNIQNSQNLNTLETLIRSEQSLERLRKIQAVEERELSSARRSTIAEIQTNDQRVVYGESAKESLVFYYWLALALYGVAYIVYLWKGPFIENRGYRTWGGWVLPVFFLLLGAASRSLVNKAMSGYSYLMWVISNQGPKDAYIDLR